MKQLAVVFSLLLMIACSSKPSFTTIEVKEFEEFISDSTIQLLDVRTLEEYNEGHIRGAQLSDIEDSLFIEKTEPLLDKNKKVAIYCRTGRKSRMASEKLSKKGYDVTELEGGITEWINEGLPTEK